MGSHRKQDPSSPPESEQPTLFELRGSLKAMCQDEASRLDRIIRKNRTTFIWENDPEVFDRVTSITVRGGNPSNELTDVEYVRLQRQLGKNVSRLRLYVVSRLCIIRDTLVSLATTNVSITQDVGDFRSIVERVADLYAFTNLVQPHLQRGKVRSFEGLIELTEEIPSTLGTGFGWKQYQLTSFEEMPSRPGYSHNPETMNQDFLRKQILNAVDKVSKGELPGLSVNRRSNVTPNRRPILTPFARADGGPATGAGGWERGAWKRTALM